MTGEEFGKAMEGFDLEVQDDDFPAVNGSTYAEVRGCHRDVLRLYRRLHRIVEREQKNFCMATTEQLAKEYGIELKDQEEKNGILFSCGELCEGDDKEGDSFWFKIGTPDWPCYELLDQLARKAHVDIVYYFVNSVTEYYETNDDEERGIFGNYLVFISDDAAIFTGIGHAIALLREFYDDEQSLYEASLEMGSSDCFEVTKDGRHFCSYNLDAIGYGIVEGHFMEYSRT